MGHVGQTMNSLKSQLIIGLFVAAVVFLYPGKLPWELDEVANSVRPTKWVYEVRLCPDSFKRRPNLSTTFPQEPGFKLPEPIDPDAPENEWFINVPTLQNLDKKYVGGAGATTNSPGKAFKNKGEKLRIRQLRGHIDRNVAR
eukprot:1184165-Prorocentrum_minimum.AAC.3